jgi:hypothetical protein
VITGTAVVGFMDSGMWSASFGLSYRDMLLHDVMTSQRIVRPGGTELRALVGAGGLPGGRNKISKDFLEVTDGEYLFMVDTDMGFAPDTVDRLMAVCDADKPVVGALCFACLRYPPKDPQGSLYAERFTVQPTLYRYVEQPDSIGFLPFEDYPRDQLVNVSGTGAAAMMIHRSALELVRDKFGPSWFDPITHPTALKGGPRTFSEDLSFCLRVQAVDLPLYVDTSVKTSHHKGAIFLDEETFELSRMTRDLVKGV